MIRIAITGPESSGKTTLAKLLSNEYDVTFVPEFAREYLEQTAGRYTENDLSIIAHGHHKGILAANQTEPKSKMCIVDTDFVVLGIWSEYKYGRIAKEIEALIRTNMFDLHILCSPDIPWEHDELRENPNDRDKLFDLYKQTLDNHGKNYITVNGSTEERMKKAIEAIGKL